MVKPDWKKALICELTEAMIISKQARNGWLFDSPLAERYLHRLGRLMDWVDRKLRPSLPVTVKQWGVTVTKPFKIDGSHTKMVHDWMGEDVGQVGGHFTRIEFEDMNLRSDKQVKEYLLELGWVPTWWNFSKKTGDRTSPRITEKTSKELCPNLLKLDGDKAKLIVMYLTSKHRHQTIAGLLKVVRPDGRIPGEANTLGAATHRMRHRKIVNIPGSHAYMGKAMRSMFTSRKGYKIVGIDSKSNQVRMLCHYMGDDEYTQQVVDPNGDIHSHNQMLAKLPTRADAKTFFYGFLFGAGDEKTGKIVGGGKKAGKQLKETFFNSLPKLRLLVKRVKNAVEKQGYVLGLDGRKVYISSSHKALNYLLQSAEAIYMKYAHCIFNAKLQKTTLDARFVVTMHDEWQLEVKDEDVDEVVKLGLESMLEAGRYLNINLPMEGDAQVGNNWSETH